MGLDRYLLIMRNLHFSDNSVDSNESDRLFKIRHLIDYFNNKMNNVYYPGKELSLDESMVLWRGRLLFRQFIQNKRYKYGIKLLMLGEYWFLKSSRVESSFNCIESSRVQNSSTRKMSSAQKKVEY